MLNENENATGVPVTEASEATTPVAPAAAPPQSVQAPVAPKPKSGFCKGLCDDFKRILKKPVSVGEEFIKSGTTAKSFTFIGVYAILAGIISIMAVFYVASLSKYYEPGFEDFIEPFIKSAVRYFVIFAIAPAVLMLAVLTFKGKMDYFVGLKAEAASIVALIAGQVAIFASKLIAILLNLFDAKSKVIAYFNLTIPSYITVLAAFISGAIFVQLLDKAATLDKNKQAYAIGLFIAFAAILSYVYNMAIK